MKILFNLAKVLFSVLVILCSVSSNYAEEGNKLNILWQKDFGCGENLGCSPGAANFDKTNNTLLIIGTSFRGVKNLKSDIEGKFWLWGIDQEGNKVKDVLLKEAPKELKASLVGGDAIIEDLNILPNGEIYAVGQFDGFNPSFMTVEQEEKNVSTQLISEKIEESHILIKKMISLPNNNFLLIGKDTRDDGLIVKIDSEGNKLWKETYDLGEIEIFTDGVAVGDKGDFLIVGYSVKSEKPISSESSDIWILKCDAEGKIISEELFPGYPFPTNEPQVCQLDSGDFVVLYYKSPLITAIDYKVKTFSPDLKELWEKQIFKSEEKGPPSASFKIKAIPRGGFFVAGCICKNTPQLLLYEYDKKGNEIGSLIIEKGVFCLNSYLACTKDKAFIISRAEEKGRNILELVVKVIAVELTK